MIAATLMAAMATPPSAAPAQPVGAPAQPVDILAHTRHAEDLAVTPSDIWVATRGGLEHYDRRTGRRTRQFTTLDGLPELHVLGVDAGNGVRAQTRHHDCTLQGARFRCAKRARPLDPPLVVAGRAHGHRVTETVDLPGVPLVATAGSGVWLGDRPLTPTRSICTNFATSLATYNGALWVAAFDGGLCRSSDGLAFDAMDGAPRMINDLLPTQDGLWIAANAGLYRTADGSSFQRVELVDRKGVNGLAFDGTHIYATTPGVVWRMTPDERRYRAWWTPGGSHALQDVTIDGRGTAWLASEDRGTIRLDRWEWNGPRTDRSATVFDRGAGLPSSWAMKVAATPDGSIAIATLRDGVVRLDDGGHQAVNAVPDRWTLALRPEPGGLWVGTQGGAAWIADDGTSRELGGLPHPNVHAFHRFRDHLYVATEGGMARYRAP